MNVSKSNLARQASYFKRVGPYHIGMGLSNSPFNSLSQWENRFHMFVRTSQFGALSIRCCSFTQTLAQVVSVLLKGSGSASRAQLVPNRTLHLSIPCHQEKCLTAIVVGLWFIDWNSMRYYDLVWDVRCEVEYLPYVLT